MQTALQDVSRIYPPYGNQVGNQHYQLTDTKVETINGNEQSRTSDNLTETEADDRTETANETLTWDDTVEGGTVHTVQFNWSNTSWHEETGETESNGQHTLTAASGSGLHQRGITNTLTGPAGGYYEVVNVSRPRTMTLSDGHVSDTGHTQTVIDRTGTDPLTGYNVDWHWDSDDPSTWTNEGDWFKQVSDFGAGMADTLTAGLTEKIRQGRAMTMW